MLHVQDLNIREKLREYSPLQLIDARCLQRIRASLGESTLVAFIGDLDWEIRRNAALALAGMGNVSNAVRAVLREAIGNEADPAMQRVAAASALGLLGVATDIEIRAVLAFLDDAETISLPDEAGIHISMVVRALGKCGDARQDIIEYLVRALGHSFPAVAVEAIEALCRQGQQNLGAQKALIKTIQGNKQFGGNYADVRRAAANAIGNLPLDIATHMECCKALLAALSKDNDTLTRRAAATALGLRAQPTPEVVKALSRAVEYPELGIQRAAVEALGRLRADEPIAVNALVRVLQDSEEAVLRRDAVQAIGQIGPKASAAVPHLLNALRAASDSLREWVLFALKEIGRPREVPLSKLEQMLDERILDPALRSIAANALGISLGGGTESTMVSNDPPDAFTEKLGEAIPLSGVEKRSEKGIAANEPVMSALLADAYSQSEPIRMNARATLQELATNKASAKNVVNQLLRELCNDSASPSNDDKYRFGNLEFCVNFVSMEPEESAHEERIAAAIKRIQDAVAGLLSIEERREAAIKAIVSTVPSIDSYPQQLQAFTGITHTFRLLMARQMEEPLRAHLRDGSPRIDLSLEEKNQRNMLLAKEKRSFADRVTDGLFRIGLSLYWDGKGPCYLATENMPERGRYVIRECAKTGHLNYVGDWHGGRNIRTPDDLAHLLLRLTLADAAPPGLPNRLRPARDRNR